MRETATVRVRIKFVVLLTLLIGIAGGARAAIQDNGIWWNNLTDGEKIYFIDGFEDGILYGDKLFDQALLVVHPRFDPEFERTVVEAEGKIQEQLKRDLGSRSIGQIVAGLDTIYADYRNTAITVNEAIIVALRSMDGTPDAEVAKLLQRKRKEAPN
jgi:hypothetical protein